MRDLLSIWESVLIEVSKNVPKSKMLTWFLHSALLEMNEDNVLIGIPSTFYLSFYEKHSGKFVLEALQKEYPKIQTIEYKIDGSLENEKQHLTADVGAMFGGKGGASLNMEDDTEGKNKGRKLPKQSSVKLTKQGEEFISKMLNTSFTLRNFVIGEENQLAHAAAQAVANAPGGAYNPLFIYGSVGLGKTHLLQATANEILRKNPSLLVVYLTTENFIAEVVDAIQKRKMEQIRKKYRKVDVFILDDIQFLAGKDRTQEIFFHLFNDLYAGKKQMIFSSDRPPMELELTEDRLKSRFSMGMIADIQFPEYETRLAICKVKANELGVMLNDEILNFIAFNVQNSVREIQGILLQLKASIELQAMTPTLDSVASVLQKMNKEQTLTNSLGQVVSSEKKTLSSMDDIIMAVSDKYGVDFNEVKGKKRSKQFMIPRQVSMYFIKKYLKVSFQDIGNHFSGRDHSSVLHANKKIDTLKKSDPEFWKELNGFESDFIWG